MIQFNINWEKKKLELNKTTLGYLMTLEVNSRQIKLNSDGAYVQATFPASNQLQPNDIEEEYKFLRKNSANIENVYVKLHKALESINELISLYGLDIKVLEEIGIRVSKKVSKLSFLTSRISPSYEDLVDPNSSDVPGYAKYEPIDSKVGAFWIICSYNDFIYLQLMQSDNFSKTVRSYIYSVVLRRKKDISIELLNGELFRTLYLKLNSDYKKSNDETKLYLLALTDLVIAWWLFLMASWLSQLPKNPLNIGSKILTQALANYLIFSKLAVVKWGNRLIFRASTII